MAHFGIRVAGPRMLDLPDGPSVDVAKLAARNHPTIDAREYLALGPITVSGIMWAGMRRRAAGCLSVVGPGQQQPRREVQTPIGSPMEAYLSPLGVAGYDMGVERF